MLKLTKMTGAGNTFLICDLRKEPLPVQTRSQLTEKLCNPHCSIGADGVVYLEKSKVCDVKWDFYNADGSSAEMCGNAARCVALYINKMTHQSNLTIETKIGIVHALVHNPNRIVISIPRVKLEYITVKFMLRNRHYYLDFVNSGVPHAVVQTHNLENVDKLGDTVDKIRALKLFKKAGVNVTFFKSQSKSSIHSLTFERGVQGYTQACGTGALAATISFLKGASGRVTVHVPGGKLFVDLTNNQPYLIGPAKFIAEIKLP